VIERWRRTYYTPEDDVRAVLLRLPGEARHTLDCECYGLADEAFVAALIAAGRRGVAIRVMCDRTQSAGPADRAVLQALVDANLPGLAVRIVESTQHRIDHLKMLILDGVDGALADSSSVWNGSYNFSAAAEQQDNYATWDNDPGLVAQAVAKFRRDWTQNPARPEWQILPTRREGA